ncbi:MAG: ParB/RepB/Spo0J family partition protein [Acidiferrobacteraceae bacterium]
MTKKPRLGRGLDALLGGMPEASSPAGTVTEIPVDLLDRGRYQPRKRFDEPALTELADSIRSSGVVQPLIVRPVPGGRYELIAGERRWRAAQMAGLAQVPALVRELSDDAALAVSLIENIQREDLNAVEEARALARLVEEFSLTHEEVARRVGRSRPAVSNLLRLLSLEDPVLDLLAEGRIEMGHARALLALPGADQRRLATLIADRGLSVREAERLIRSRQTGGSSGRRERGEDKDVRALANELSDRLGARVRLLHRANGGGRLVIDYSSLEELEGLLERFR